jgi:hypothetical protein
MYDYFNGAVVCELMLGLVEQAAEGWKRTILGILTALRDRYGNINTLLEKLSISSLFFQ